MSLIVIVILAIYFVLIAWSWHSLGAIQKLNKFVIVIIGILMMYVITLIVFNFSKMGVNYDSVDIQKNIKNILVAVFTGINGIIILPQLYKVIEMIKEDDIDGKKALRRIALLIIVFIICIVFECGYMKDTQEGILKIYNSMR